SLDRLRGLEGQGAALYFSQFGKLLRVPQFDFTHRNRRPPRDPVNACLSFGYAVLGSLVESQAQRCGLDPTLGFLHQAAYGRPSLALDVLEEFRPLVDGLVLRLLNRRQLGPNDFERRSDISLEEALARPDVREGATERLEEESGAAFDDRKGFGVQGSGFSEEAGESGAATEPPTRAGAGRFALTA
ncbi:MAG TPA: CRISPR-associated endonuclease Cas1, partial [Pirellulales bacterium]|nr:CRISPR-associated endonuclease Cas1 [Pirellulales bacterium]